MDQNQHIGHQEHTYPNHPHHGPDFGFAYKNQPPHQGFVNPPMFPPNAVPYIDNWLKVEDYATQIRIIALQQKAEGNVSPENIKKALEKTARLHDQLLIILQQRGHYYAPEPDSFTFPDTTNQNAKIQTKKRKKNDQSRVCQLCSTSDTPEWRRGPGGPRTLCNACGLKWAKKRRTQEKRDITQSSQIGQSKIPASHIPLPTLPQLGMEVKTAKQEENQNQQLPLQQ